VITLIVQGLEYSVSSFTISDGVFGTCFFFGTGFHGLGCSPINLDNIKKTPVENNKVLVNNTNTNGLLITLPVQSEYTSEVNSYYLEREFLE
jgi:hypothetical protein